MTSLEQRQKIRHLVNQGIKAPQIGRMLGLSVYVVRKWQQRIKKGAPYIQKWDVLQVR